MTPAAAAGDRFARVLPAPGASGALFFHSSDIFCRYNGNCCGNSYCIGGGEPAPQSEDRACGRCRVLCFLQRRDLIRNTQL